MNCHWLTQKGEQLSGDFQSAEIAVASISEAWVQASLLLLIDPDTKLLVLCGRRVEKELDPVGKLYAGALIVHRGDLSHADVPYKDGNLRLKASVRVDGIVHDDGIVERVAWVFFRFQHCFKRCDSKLALSNHYRACNENPRMEEIAKKCKRNNDMGAFCEECQRHFGKTNLYYAHDCLGHHAAEEESEVSEYENAVYDA
ncbi:Zinc finger, C2H2 [Phytophthora cactorum]|nr:Zinc finger, C2H2 [Phytophthora cactorum]